MKTDREIASDEIPRVCRLLRTKTAFGGHDEWKRGESTTAAYWCLNTMEPVGPDDAPAHPHHCDPRRCCFQDPDFYNA